MPTAIQWTEETWNPTTGCTKVSPGCANCYITTTMPFRMEGRKFVNGATDLRLHPDRLDKPLHWRKPRRVFVNSLSDLFHEDIVDSYIAAVYDVMRRAPQHTFQVLTKRPERARDFLAHLYNPTDEPDLAPLAPFPNVWVGVSIENARYTWRADVLREIPAAVRFISAEPLLGSLFEDCPPGERVTRDPALPDRWPPNRLDMRHPLDLTGIDWVIIGGESGPKARPFRIEHAREIIRAARDLVPKCICYPGMCPQGCEPACAYCQSQWSAPAVFVKQLGAKPVEWLDGAPSGWPSYDRPLKLRDRKGGVMDEWPADLRIREFPRGAA